MANFFSLHNLQLFSNIPIIYGVNSANIFTVIYLGVVVTGFGYLFYFMAMEETSVSTASVVFFIKPALAPVLALIILRESIPLNTLAGIAFIIKWLLYYFYKEERVSFFSILIRDSIISSLGRFPLLSSVSSLSSSSL